MGFKSKFLGTLKNLGGCMSAPKADKNEPMKQKELCDPPKDEEEMESVNSKNEGDGEERNIVGNPVTMDLLVDNDEIEEKEDEISTTLEKPSEDEDNGKEVKNNSEEEEEEEKSKLE